MLPSSTVEQNLGFSVQLTEQNKRLLPKQGSLLEQLVTASLPLQDLTEINAEEIGRLIELNTTNTEDIVSPHSTASDAAVDMLSSVVTQHIKVAKETVLPIVKDVTEQVIAYDTTLKLYDAMNDITIKMFKRTALMDTAELLDMLDNYKGASAIRPNFVTFSSKSKDEILLLCMTGSKNLDNEILQHLSSLDDMDITSIYNSMFNYVNAEVNITELVAAHGFSLFNTALIGFLVARRLYDQVDPEVKGMTLPVYKSTVAAIRDYCAVLLIQALESIENSARTELIILRLDRRNKVIEVNDVNYKKWLESNTEEAILGTLVADRAYFTAPMILQYKDTLVQGWTNYKTYLTLKRTQENDQNIRNFMSKMIYDGVHAPESLSDIEQEYIKTNASHAETAKKYADEFVANLSINDMDNLPEVCLALVTKCRFYFTSAFDILNGMHEVEKVNPHINPREAALISVLYYITDYFVDQIKVETLA